MKKALLYYSLIITILSIFLVVDSIKTDEKYKNALSSLEQLSKLINDDYRNLVGRQFVDFTLEDLSGKIWRLNDIDSTIKIVVFFNINDCAQCLQDYRIWNMITTKYPKKIMLLAINNNQIHEVTDYLAQKTIRYPVLTDPSSFIKDSMGIHSSPLMVIMNKDNRIIDVDIPGKSDPKQIIKRIENYISE